MGMTAPGLYRYFGSHEELIRHAIAGIFTELGADVRQAVDAAAMHADMLHADAASDDPRPPAVRLTVKMIAACREFRRWALNHKAEFALLFGVPLPGLDDERHDIADQCALEFAAPSSRCSSSCGGWRRSRCSADDELDPGLLSQLTRYRDTLGTDVPIGTLLTFLRYWTLLYGAVSIEVFGHMEFALEDPAPMFEITLSDMFSLVRLSYPLPG
jgi:AcrR family transcriptional regulator